MGRPACLKKWLLMILSMVMALEVTPEPCTGCGRARVRSGWCHPPVLAMQRDEYGICLRFFQLLHHMVRVILHRNGLITNGGQGF